MDELISDAVQALREIVPDRTTFEAGEERLHISFGDGRAASYRVRACPDLTKEKAAEELSRLPTSGRSAPEGDEPVLIVTGRVTEGAATLLREQGQCYLDAAGNSYLRHQDLLIFIQGRKSSRSRRGRPRRAFNAAGLKLIFVLLTREGIPSRTYREIASVAGVSRGAVGYVLSDLEDMGHLTDLGDGRRKLQRVPDLISRWATGYAERLRPKLMRGRFRFLREEQRNNWKEIALDPTRSVWGGEPAADLLTGYLRPERFSIYTQETTADLLSTLQAIPDPDGPIEILDMFWDDGPLQEGSEAGAAAPPLLAYADLLATAESRNLEVAEMIYRDYLTEDMARHGI
jgi:hypothetical protein